MADETKAEAWGETTELDAWKRARVVDIVELRGQVRNLQLAVARLEAAAKGAKR